MPAGYIPRQSYITEPHAVTVCHRDCDSGNVQLSLEMLVVILHALVAICNSAQAAVVHACCHPPSLPWLPQRGTTLSLAALEHLTAAWTCLVSVG
jgi:hypothetical protein